MTNPPIHQQLTRHSNQQTRITLIKTKGQPPDQSRLPTTRSLIESLITQSKPIPITIHHPMRTNSQSKVIKTITISPIKLNSRLTDHQPMNHTTKRQNQGLISKPLPDHNSRIKWNQQTTTSLNNTTRIKPWPHKPRVKQKWTKQITPSTELKPLPQSQASVNHKHLDQEKRITIPPTPNLPRVSINQPTFRPKRNLFKNQSQRILDSWRID